MPALARNALSTAPGLAMVGLAAFESHGAALVVAAAAGLMVGLGTVYRFAATGAVLLTVLVIVLFDVSHILVALSGLCAAAYLVSRHATASWPTTVAAVGFTFVGLVATSFPLQVPWLPLVAPLAVLAIYVVATRPFLS
ncbi:MULTISPECIES: hypothetical protein [Mycobacterium]|uniref:Integral membrane protein n=1 Tax=Mycobacterium kiyosense TaxID=2871094 RepID=A0A9P3QBI2_9MYCO|nr:MULTISPECIES: hypothetical protein [Mycobacterium]BDB41055.1 integral membrane protein [Mycobacterium kiyosense]BDE12850.1 integral membrane protein [Mycobacterium sp. 20KCMC460]GLB84279.1 integral membrane protein [Mycobacterium kiyosense]GLB90271.1 integral membrane protein [Mycobacterium kiyosense]GLB97686.1 integral membrane protein [Mycobacterium kiyosense]